MASATCKVIWLGNLLHSLRLKWLYPGDLFCDNNSAILPIQFFMKRQNILNFMYIWRGKQFQLELLKLLQYIQIYRLLMHLQSVLVFLNIVCFVENLDCRICLPVRKKEACSLHKGKAVWHISLTDDVEKNTNYGQISPRAILSLFQSWYNWLSKFGVLIKKIQSWRS